MLAQDKPRFGRYLGIIFGAAMISAATLLPIGWLYNVLPCDYGGYRSGHFLAYCSATMFADYEHGAYFLNLEPEAVANLRRAEVLFLGNSRTQFGLSTPAMRGYFLQRKVRYYVFGFNYDELSAFPSAILDKIGARPKVLVVNTDPFFLHNRMSPVALEASSGSLRIAIMSRIKRAFQAIHAPLCEHVPILCHLGAPTFAIFRTISDGQYLISPRQGDVPVAGAKPLTLDPSIFDEALTAANDFLDHLGVNRDCVVLTVVPAAWSDATNVARRLAQATKVQAIFPKVEGLMTFDGSHLDTESADRWSAALLLALDPIIKRCVSANE